MTGDEVAEAWRHASPAAVHPELDGSGMPTMEWSAAATLQDLLSGIDAYMKYKPESVLDYAAGPGRLAVHLLDHFTSVTIADTNPAYLDIASTRGEFTVLQVDTIPAFLPPVDVIVCVNLFIHLPNETADQLLTLFAATLNPGGLLALHVPLYEQGRTPEHWTAVGTWTIHQLRQSATQAGLRVFEAHSNHGAYTGTPGPYHAALAFLGHA